MLTFYRFAIMAFFTFLLFSVNVTLCEAEILSQISEKISNYNVFICSLLFVGSILLYFYIPTWIDAINSAPFWSSPSLLSNSKFWVKVPLFRINNRYSVLLDLDQYDILNIVKNTNQFYSYWFGSNKNVVLTLDTINFPLFQGVNQIDLVAGVNTLHTFVFKSVSLSAFLSATPPII